jgi:hypothetical protein
MAPDMGTQGCAATGPAAPARARLPDRAPCDMLGVLREEGQLAPRTIVAAFLAAGSLGGWIGCGGSASPSAPAVAPVTTPAAPSPAAPSPSPVAVTPPTPDPPDPTPQESPEINDNDAPVDRVGAGVYYVECNGELQPNSRNAREVPVGCRVHLDATPKDADNVPTNPRFPPEWFFSSPGEIDISGSNPLGPMITGKRPHKQTINVWVDGVQSNTFSVTFF